MHGLIVLIAEEAVVRRSFLVRWQFFHYFVCCQL